CGSVVRTVARRGLARSAAAAPARALARSPRSVAPCRRDEAARESAFDRTARRCATADPEPACRARAAARARAEAPWAPPGARSAVADAPALTAAAISALANRFRHHAEPFDSRPAHAVHRLDDGAVGEAGVRLEIERLVRPVLERITEGLLEGAGREALVVEEESLFLGDGEDH